MLKKYRNLSEYERWIEYGRLKREYCEQHGYGDLKKYDEFIARIVRELGL